MTRSFVSRLGIVVLAIHAVLLPALYVQLDRIVRRSFQERFVTEIRTYARLLADDLALPGALDSMDLVQDRIENVLLSGEGVFGRLDAADGTTLVELATPGFSPAMLNESFSFADRDDRTYVLSMPVVNGDRELRLWIGFDEDPVTQEISLAHRHLSVSLGIYFLVVLLVSALAGIGLTRPLRSLKNAARRVAGGDFGLKLGTSSGVREFRSLAESMETMRTELLAAGDRLRSETRQREQEAEERHRLELRLQVRRRLETIGTLASGIAHEINNTLVPIQLLTEMAIEDLEPASPIRSDLVRVLENARRAKRIVGDILLFARRPEVQELQAVDLSRVVREVGELYGRLAPAGVQMHEDIEVDSPMVQGDEAMLSQIVTNLCANAVQASAGSPGVVTISLHPAAADEAAAAGLPAGDYLVLRVRDTGHGMDEATQKRIFEPFFTTRPAGEGTGLGLSVVHGMVGSLGGAISVDSAPAAGAAFSVFLPRANGLQGQKGGRDEEDSDHRR